MLFDCVCFVVWGGIRLFCLGWVFGFRCFDFGVLLVWVWCFEFVVCCGFVVGFYNHSFVVITMLLVVCLLFVGVLRFVVDLRLNLIVVCLFMGWICFGLGVCCVVWFCWLGWVFS